MLRFFRKIRRDLLANSQFFKYLKYAIGEIVLVVLGILIALFINNWNEEQKNQKQFDTILSEVEQELVFNIKNIRSGIEYFHRFDSIFSIAIHEGLERKDFENDTTFLLRNLPGFSIEFQTESYLRLIEIGQGRTPQQDTIFRVLSSLYNKDTLEYTQSTKEYSRELTEKILESREQYPWFANLYLSQPYSDEEIDYYINNPQYKADLIKTAGWTLVIFGRLLKAWDYRLLKSYNRVYKYLENHKLNHSDSLYFEQDLKHFNHYLGRYKFIESTGYMSDYNLKMASESFVEIELEDDQYKISIKSISEEKELLNWGIVRPVSKYYFVLVNDGYPSVYLTFDENDKVSGLSVGNTLYKLKFEKIE